MYSRVKHTGGLKWINFLVTQNTKFAIILLGKFVVNFFFKRKPEEWAILWQVFAIL